ncbi:PAS domain S-box protein [bacterium]|nr:PAS domain S-box protein [bacterium]
MTKKKILIVEDEAIVSKDLEIRLKNLNYQVVGIASSGEEAMEIVAENEIDLILMDIMLSGKKDGITTAQEINDNFNVPIIYLTAYSDKKTLERAKKTGHFGYITKPFDGNQLQITIEMVLYKSEMEEKLRKSERWSSTVLKSIGDAVITTDTQGNITFMNEIAELLTGWDNKDAIGKPLVSIFKIINQTTRKEAKNPVQNVIKTGKIVGLANHTVLIAKDGKEFSIDDSAAPIKNENGKITGAVLVFRDITERYKTEQLIRENKANLEAVIENSKSLIWSVDTNYKIITINSAFKNIFHTALGKKIKIGDCILDLLPQNLKEDWKNHLQKALKGQIFTANFDYPVNKKNTYYEVSFNPIFESEKVIGASVFAIDITDYLEIQHSLEKSKNKYLTFINNIEEGIYCIEFEKPILITDSEEQQLEKALKYGYFTECNKVMAKMYGLEKAEDLIGVRITDFLLQDEKNFEQLKKIIRANYKISGLETVEKDKDGNIKYFLNNYTGTIENNCLLQIWGTQVDITELKKTQNELTDEKELLAVTLNEIAEGILTTDKTGIITSINKQAEKITGWTNKDAVGKFLSEVFYVIDKNTNKLIQNPFSKLLRFGQVANDFRNNILIDKNEIHKNVTYNAAPIKHNENEIVGMVLAFQDITEKLKIEEELQKTNKLQSIGTLAGGIAHNFNNILMGILGNVSLCKNLIPNNSKAIKRLEEVEKASTNAKTLTQQLLTFAEGGMPIKKTGSIAELIRDFVNFIFVNSNLKREIDIQDDLWFVDFDAEQINQAINNLVINAMQAMPVNGAIKVTCKNIPAQENKSIPYPNEGDYILISISDSGIGIPEENKRRIFEPYFTTKEKNYGLGLATAYSIVSKHKGYINFESEVKKGTTFNIYLPVAETLPFSEEEIAKSQAKQKSNSKKKILVMDDDETIREIIFEMLTYVGYEVVTAGNGTETLNLYQKQRDFDAVIIDLTIQGEAGGKEIIEKLLKINPKIKAIVSSGYTNDIMMIDFQSYGFSGAIAKPFNLKVLVEVVEQVIAL